MKKGLRSGARDKSKKVRPCENFATPRENFLRLFSNKALLFSDQVLIPGAFQFYLLKAKCQNFSHFLIGFKTGGILQLFARAPHHMLHPVAKKRLHIFTFKPQGAIQTFSVGIFQIDQ